MKLFSQTATTALIYLNFFEGSSAAVVQHQNSLPLIPWQKPLPSLPFYLGLLPQNPIVTRNAPQSSGNHAVQCLKKKKSISGIPGAKSLFDDFQGTHSEQTPTIHWVGHFVLWHRYFVAAYEAYLRGQCGYAGAQPYWDWEYDNASGLDMAKWSIFSSTTGFGGNGPYKTGDNPFGIPDRSGGGCVPDGPFTYPGFKVNMGPGNSTGLGYNPHCLTRDFSRPLMKWGNQTGINWVWDTANYGQFTPLRYKCQWSIECKRHHSRNRMISLAISTG
ncbi:hypothetical protein H072_9325 [Dactylellina haptotyla CBS 200.50]|uniref:Tyrosinase copper-binding domain-containing protein n=1 Tax=Dactylellina haptotyla (strain CBS 200.50) TaxID=1284197 RepID=S8BPF4_DACHA|nr:hypothetical protein H072_9325 [Dactylellina haptotyla CBS 200.50]